MKKFQHVHIILLSLLFVGCLGMTILALSSFREMIIVKNENEIAATSVSASILKQNKEAYTKDSYKDVINLFNNNYVSSNVVVEIKNNLISITSTSIENELDVRQAMLSLLALDKNLVVESMCGKIDGTCNGFPLEVILRGEKNSIIIVEQPLTKE